MRVGDFPSKAACTNEAQTKAEVDATASCPVADLSARLQIQRDAYDAETGIRNFSVNQFT